MATTRGCSGKVKAGSAASAISTLIGELRDWSYEETSEQIDVSAMGDCTKKFAAGAKATQGQISAWWDGADSGQNLLVVGNTVHLALYPGGDASGKVYYKTPTGGAVITGVSREGGGVDGTVGASFTFTVNGALVTTSVP
ncbi:MAG: hypothetical protein D6744_02865 [Planctomycetota bacterium]|nr:MAG: hypothetical protein D6744_02865 [Planctomycetota bacterium]